MRATKTEHSTVGTTHRGPAQTSLPGKQDNVTIKGLQANVSIPKVNRKVFHVSLKEENVSVVLAFLFTTLSFRNICVLFPDGLT